MCRVVLLGLVFVVALWRGAHAQNDVRFGGFVQLDRRVTLADSLRLADFYNVFRPELSASFEGRVDVVVSLDLRFYDFTGVESTNELEEADQHFPNTLTVWEAFARVSEFLFDPLDLTIGKQRIQWGTADGLNPTDRFNAYDVSDLTDFTARIPVWAVRGEYYPTADWRVEAVWTPTAHGPVLPPGMGGMFASAGAPVLSAPVASWEPHFEPPSPRFGNSQYGLKVAGRAAGLDLAVSYFDGFDGIPLVERFAFVTTDSSPASPFVGHTWSTLPRLRVFGADVATEWRGIGLWGEGAVVFPSEIEVVTDVLTPDHSVRERVIGLEGQPYTTWTVGGDYTFGGGWYLNLQWAHGLFLERGAGQLHDYLVGSLERRLFRGTMTISVEGAAELAQWGDWSDHLGYAVFPAVVYSPVDNVDVSVGGLLAGGGGATLFGRWSDVDQIYVRVKAVF